MNVDLHYFFAGAQGKEVVASAWLATLLQHDERFRAGFLDSLPAGLALNADAKWTVEIEASLDGFCDVTMRTPGVFVLIENKIASSAKRKNQLLTYYVAALKAHEADQLVGIYVGPTAEMGRSETERVEHSDEFIARRQRPRPDFMVCLGWKDDISDLVDEAAGGTLFKASGLREVLAHIERTEAGITPSPEREQLRAAAAMAVTRLVARFGERVHLSQWSSIGQEAIYTAKAPITVFVTLDFNQDRTPPHAIRNVFKGEELTLSVGLSLGLSASGRKNPGLVSKWQGLITQGAITIPGLDIGPLPAASRRRFAADTTFTGTQDELVDVLVRRGSALLDVAEKPATSV